MRLIKYLGLIICLAASLSGYGNANIIPAPPKIKATAHLVMDFNSGDLLIESNIEERLPPASLTKIMTVYIAASELANKRITLTETVLVSEKAWRTQGSKMFIEVGKMVKIDDLLSGIIIQSGNDASVALAEHISGTEDSFVILMNQHAKRLGMHNTNYTNSTGLPDQNQYTTALDLAILTRAFINDFPEIYAKHKIKEFTFNNIKQRNRNRLLWHDSSVDGLKTGHTKAAGYCLVASALKDNMRLISVVMGMDSPQARTKASQALLNYSYRFYKTLKLYDAATAITNIRIWQGDSNMLSLGLSQDLYITFPRSKEDSLETVLEINEPVLAPVNQGDRKGQLNIMIADQKIKTVPLIALETVAAGSFFKRIKDKFWLLLD